MSATLEEILNQHSPSTKAQIGADEELARKLSEDMEVRQEPEDFQIFRTSECPNHSPSPLCLCFGLNLVLSLPPLYSPNRFLLPRAVTAYTPA